jgi:putative SbcD/Mre11-related phosphoesterase
VADDGPSVAGYPTDTPAIDPIPDERAAIARFDGERALVIADYHAGIEAAFRQQGVSVASRAGERRDRLLGLLAEHDPDRLIVLGDLMHSIGGPGGAEREEVETLTEALSLPVTVSKGNHDGAIESWLPGVTVSGTGGFREDGIGFAHGHAWPDPDLLTAEVLCIGHEHPQVRLTDEVGGEHVDPVWVRGALDSGPFVEHASTANAEAILAGWGTPELVLVPAFNDLVGGTWVNEGDFLTPFLSAGLPAGDVFLLDGTRLGDYRDLENRRA